MLPRDRFAAYSESQNQNTVNIPISAVSSIPPFALDSNFTSKAIALFLGRVLFVDPLLSICFWKLSRYFIAVRQGGNASTQLLHVPELKDRLAVTSHRKNCKDLM